MLLYLGRNFVQGSALITWVLTLSATTGVAVLIAAIYRLRLQLEASRLELARKEAELSFALEVQRALFPRQLPKTTSLEFAAVCIPARGISGDYYDVLELPDGRVVFAIADISGKGISAAILMANVQALLRALTQTGATPRDVIARLNQHLHQVTDDSRFATFFYAEWDELERQLTYINAGHHPPLVFGSLCEKRLTEGGLPIGLFAHSDFQAGQVALQYGDMIALYSDGITEAESAGGEEFGEQRLRRIIESHLSKPLVEIQEAVISSVREWAGREPQDDMTLLIVRANNFAREGL
ncbi:MAG: PP2C family protein-serine/threonine phosphatase [Acidobacteriota bacterium]